MRVVIGIKKYFLRRTKIKIEIGMKYEIGTMKKIHNIKQKANSILSSRTNCKQGGIMRKKGQSLK
jgi:hypothetical protein